MADKTLDTGFLRGLFALLQQEMGWLPLAIMVGLGAGLTSAVFLSGLDTVTAYRVTHPWLLLGLPLAGLAVGFVYHECGGVARRGTALILETLHTSGERIPLRMLPLVLLGTWVSHLFGASVGREGTALQMSASLADQIAHRLKLSALHRRHLLITSIAAGFGAVFGTPAAGVVFALEVQTRGAPRYEGLLSAVVAALVGHMVTHALGIQHSRYPALPTLPLDAVLLVKVALAAVCFGLTARLFIALTERIKTLFVRVVAYPPLRPLIGGMLLAGFTLLVATDAYNGLSIGLAQAAVRGESVPMLAFLLKLAATALSLGAGFVGGEVTPLFVIGATLGATLESVLHAGSGLLASLGFVMVFAAASNTPLACVLLGVELFGSGALIYLLVGCLIAFVISGQSSIYSTQRQADQR